MEPWVVKRGKEEYVFHSDRLVITRKGKIYYDIHYSEIEKIEYNHKFRPSDIIGLTLFLNTGSSFTCFPGSFTIRFKNDEYLCMRIPRDDFERIKNMIPVPIELI